MQTQITVPSVPVTEAPLPVVDNGRTLTHKELMRSFDIIMAAQDEPFDDHWVINLISIQAMKATQDYTRCNSELYRLEQEQELAFKRDLPAEEMAELNAEQAMLEDQLKMNGRRVLRQTEILEGLMHAMMDKLGDTAPEMAEV